MTKALFTALAATLVLLTSLSAPLAAQAPLPRPLLKATDIEGASSPTIVINQPGVYFLPRELQTSDELAVDVRADNVTIDLRGHTLVGLGDRIGVGIKVDGVSGFKVSNGKLRDFGIGVQIVNSTNAAVTGLQIEGEDLGGTPPDVEIGVLLVNSRGVRVSDNTISDTFLGIFVRGDCSGANILTGNLLAGGDNGELAICYNPAPGADGGGPSGDLIEGNLASRFRRGFSFSTDSAGNVLRGNTFAYFDLGVVEATPGSNSIRDNDEVQIAP